MINQEKNLNNVTDIKGEQIKLNDPNKNEPSEVGLTKKQYQLHEELMNEDPVDPGKQLLS